MRDKTLIGTLLAQSPQWANTPGPLCDVISTSRLRLARNLDSLPFPNMALPEQAETVVSRVRGLMSQAAPLVETAFLNMEDLSRSEGLFLTERRLISRDLAVGRRARGVLVGKDEVLSVMVNEEDHLRFQVMLPGLQLGPALEQVSQVEAALEGYLAFAYSEDYGYLTACPTNVGTGLRASVLAHLPGLVLTRRISKLLRAAQAMNMAVRGFQGEGSEVVGNFIQISNQTTLGLDEYEIVRRLEGLVHTLVEQEQDAVDFMWSTAGRALEDKVYRALGTLAHARSIGMEEVLGLSSAVRLGHRLNLKGLPSIQVLNEIIIQSQPAHLERWAGGPLSAEEGGFLRADHIRSRLAGPRKKTWGDSNRN